MSDLRIRRFRLRVMIATGLAIGHGPLVGAARAASTGADSDGSGSSGSGTDGDSTESSGSTGSSTGDSDTVDPECEGCYGRPYVANERARIATLVDSDAWHTVVTAPSMGELAPAQRSALAAFWSQAAQAEHSSVAGFHRFALDLLAHAAPAKLVARATQAAAEELEHAQVCFSLASAYAGRPIGPGTMPLGTTAPVAATLAELATWTVNEGCVGETLAAWLATEIAGQATDPAVRTAMEKIAREELEHAELSWATIAWARAAGGPEVDAAIEAAFAVARTHPPTHGTVSMVAHGLLPDAVVGATVQRAMHEIVRPCAALFVGAA